MTEYYVPTGMAESELVEKRSRFIGHVFPVGSEAEAKARIEEMKKKYHDARHNCWCYRLKDGLERCSDDGEPQGTAGQPILNVFQREAVTDVCCVVTRYFGGVLLGAGGLVRAYAKSAKSALDAAGRSVVRCWIELTVSCSYAIFERMKLEVEGTGGILGEIEYAAEITLHALLPETCVERFQDRVIELTCGAGEAVVIGEVYRPAPANFT